MTVDPKLYETYKAERGYSRWQGGKGVLPKMRVWEPAYWAWGRGTRQNPNVFLHTVPAARALASVKREMRVLARAAELGLEAHWEDDSDYWPGTDEDQCCKVKRRIDAGYTDGLGRRERWAYIRDMKRAIRDGEKPWKAKRDCSYEREGVREYGGDLSRLEREHEHTVEGCFVPIPYEGTEFPEEWDNDPFGRHTDGVDMYGVACWGFVDMDKGEYDYRTDAEIDQLSEAIHIMEERLAAEAADRAKMDAETFDLITV
jgi:hypothetical protein